ncbi:hypothetical protein RHSIM_Rhsim03G0242700 [Rhododendron simsii]|uniref:AAA+ ATPase domain-containing protein n=1 Tax=Rhododendron simsii TaxID=118357 RepID=A0A834H4P2_RHOSS|nr:hypothetical protein RHSIM_Rhsim03G0242700 [Rhododendron simsii]
MAAEAILGIIAQKAADIFVNQLIKQSSRLSRVKEDLLWIETEMRRIQSYLEDAEAVQPKTKRVSNFIRDMWDLAYDVEDIIDTYFPKMRSSRSRLKGPLGPSNLTTARRFAKDVEGIKTRVDDITKARETFKIDESSRTREADTWDPRRTFTHVDEPNVIVGFDDLIKDLEQKVLDGNLHHRIVSIIGNAGLGKTTLARKVYNSVRQHFGCSAWICVSQQPNYKDLFRDVARQVGLEKEKIEQDVEANLFAFLNGKRYAIVIDDIWHTKAWDALKVGIPTNSEDGSRIILTSRITDVGVHVGGVNSVLELQPLDPETSRKLFYKTIVFDTQNTIKIQDSPQLEHIGEQILERCGGVPLAIVLAAVEFSLTNLQTLYGLPSNLFKADWLHNLTNLRTLLVYYPTKDIMEILIMDVTPVSQKLETLRLHYFFENLETNSVNLSRYENLASRPQYDIFLYGLGCHHVVLNTPQHYVLEVAGLDELEMVVDEEGGMPRLKDFWIIHCRPETRIPDGMRNIMRTIQYLESIEKY